VEIINDEANSYAEVFHPFIGLKTITKKDTYFRVIMSKLMKEDIEIDTDMKEIMGIERNTALMILGYLYKKGHIEASELCTNTLKIELSANAMSKINKPSNKSYSHHFK